ncbi:helix-turn-helix domain-containing protein [Tengunoibacter tsumagoiensis]|uniref:HTH cro/C1-type domain-containing protein n=1 Tax=Tengunoibacter tsumagoiensis TaxID=2014871 RepID=A0A401ZWS3_9CHLR|nr:helix-turn-helix transcriptional regulator [Tengunoibacter tsumagoiensis]GCE11262.1 hypothetical protein KTT_11210 [Tengunoibacter tsumagoiensis]
MSPEQPSSKIGKSVGEKLRAARVAQHYTQSQLAAPDFSVSYISAIERGQIHPSLRALEILAGRLGLTSTQLLPARTQADERFGTTTNLAERDDDEIQLALLELSLLIQQGEPQQAIHQLEGISVKRLKHPYLLQHHYLLGCAYYKVQRHQESENLLTAGLQQIKEGEDVYLSRRFLYQLALTYTAMRNYAQALQAYQRTLDLLEKSEPHDPFFIIQLYIQLGQHYTRTENFDQAIAMFHQALSLTEGLGSTHDIQAIYAQISSYYAESKQSVLATLYAYKCEQIHHQQTIKNLRSELHHFLGHAILQGDPARAREYLDEALQSPTVLQDALTLASIYTRNAEWYFDQKDWAVSKQNAQHANALAQTFGDCVIGAEALIMLGRINYAQQLPEAGSQYFVEGLDMLERIGAHQELADESVRYAELLESLGQEREAFTHFRRAFQSKQKLGQ